MKCNVCEFEFVPTSEKRYTATKPGILFGRSEFYDCFDCPKCGCQIIAGERFEKYEECSDTESDETDNTNE